MLDAASNRRGFSEIKPQDLVFYHAVALEKENLEAAFVNNERARLFEEFSKAALSGLLKNPPNTQSPISDIAIAIASGMVLKFEKKAKELTQTK